MRVRTSESSALYIEEFKIYDAYNVDRSGRVSFNILDEDGEKIFCLLTSCSHLDGGDWEVVEE